MLKQCALNCLPPSPKISALKIFLELYQNLMNFLKYLIFYKRKYPLNLLKKIDPSRI